MVFVLVLDHHHLKHAGQAQKCRRRQHREPNPATARHLEPCNGRGVDPVERCRHPARQTPDHEYPDGQKGKELDHRLKRNGHDHTMMALVRIQIAGAKENSEERQPPRHPEGGGLHVRQCRGCGVRFCKRSKRQRHRLQLQCNIGCRANDRQNGHDHREQVRLAIARRNEIGDRGDPLASANPHHFAQGPPPANHDQRRTQIDGDKFQPRARGKADRAIECPGGAIDRQRQGVDQR